MVRALFGVAEFKAVYRMCDLIIIAIGNIH